MKKFFTENELIAPVVIGLVAGFMQELSRPSESQHAWIKTILSTAFIVFSVFLILDMTDLSYHAKLGISALFGFLGTERALAYIKEFMQIFKQ